MPKRVHQPTGLITTRPRQRGVGTSAHATPTARSTRQLSTMIGPSQIPVRATLRAVTHTTAPRLVREKLIVRRVRNPVGAVPARAQSGFAQAILVRLEHNEQRSSCAVTLGLTVGRMAPAPTSPVPDAVIGPPAVQPMRVRLAQPAPALTHSHLA